MADRDTREGACVVGYVTKLGYLFCHACHDGEGCTEVWSDQSAHVAENCESCRRSLVHSEPTRG